LLSALKFSSRHSVRNISPLCGSGAFHIIIASSKHMYNKRHE